MPESPNPPPGTASVLLFASNAEALSMLGREFQAAAPDWRASAQVGSVVQLAGEIERGDYGIVVVEMPSVSDSDLDLLESSLRLRHPALVLVTPQLSSELLLRARRAGVREVVLANSPETELVAAMRRQIERIAAPGLPPPRGKVIAFMPAKGGSGATFLATNLGYAMAERGQRVAVIDLNLQFGDLSLYVNDRKPSTDIAHVCRDIDRLDGAMLEASMIHVGERMWVLAAPDVPERAVDVRPEAVERLLAVARARYDAVILDLGRFVDAVTIRALDDADVVYVVLQHTIPTLHDAGRLLALLSGLGYPEDKLRLVANRAEKNSDIGPAEVRKALGREAKIHVPNSYLNVLGSINRGEPIVRATPKDPVSRCLLEWADALMPQTEKRGSWLRGLFGSRS